MSSLPTAASSRADASPLFAPRRLAHVNLYVGDLDACLRFYRDVCGLTVVFDEPGVGASFLSNGNTHHDLALMQVSSQSHVGRDGHVQVSAERGSAPGLNHLAWEMRTEADLVAAIAAAPRHGVEVRRLLDHLISRSAYLADPDDVWHEFYSDSTDRWRELYVEMTDQLISARWEPDLEAASQVSFIEEDAPLVPHDGAAMRSLRTSRAAIVVSDLAASVAFYGERLGIRALAVVPGDGAAEGYAVLAGSLGNGDLLLLQQRDGDALGLHHFGLEVADDAELDAGLRRLAAAGVPVVEELRTAVGRAVVVRDPDGRLVEFFVAGGTSPADARPADARERELWL